MKSRRARTAWLLAVLGACLVGVGWWCWKRQSPEARYRRALEAFDRKDRAEVERLAGLLARQGERERAESLRAQVLFEDAEQQQEETERLARLEVSERVLRFLGGRLCEAAQGSVCRFVGVHDPTTTATVARFRPSLERFALARSRANLAFVRAEEELSALNPETPIGHEVAPALGRCALRRGDLKRAVEVYRRVAERRPDDSDVQRTLADALYELGNVDETIRHARAFSELEPDDGYGQRLIAAACRTHRRFGEARKAYREALGRQMDFHVRLRVLNEYVEMLVEDLADFDEALKVLNRYPESHGRQPEVLALRAECLWNQGKREEARKLVESALQADGDLLAALLLRGRIHLEEDQPALALPVLRRAAAWATADFRVHEQLARAYRQLADDARAAEHDRRRRELVDARTRLSVLNKKAVDHPWDADVRFEIAAIYVRLEKPPEARQWLKAALACDPAHADARRALAKLDGVAQGSP